MKWTRALNAAARWRFLLAENKRVSMLSMNLAIMLLLETGGAPAFAILLRLLIVLLAEYGRFFICFNQIRRLMNSESVACEPAFDFGISKLLTPLAVFVKLEGLP